MPTPNASGTTPNGHEYAVVGDTIHITASTGENYEIPYVVGTHPIILGDEYEMECEKLRITDSTINYPTPVGGADPTARDRWREQELSECMESGSCDRLPPALLATSQALSSPAPQQNVPVITHNTITLEKFLTGCEALGLTPEEALLYLGYAPKGAIQADDLSHHSDCGEWFLAQALSNNILFEKKTVLTVQSEQTQTLVDGTVVDTTDPRYVGSVVEFTGTGLTGVTPVNFPEMLKHIHPDFMDPASPAFRPDLEPFTLLRMIREQGEDGYNQAVSMLTLATFESTAYAEEQAATLAQQAAELRRNTALAGDPSLAAGYAESADALQAQADAYQDFAENGRHDIQDYDMPWTVDSEGNPLSTIADRQGGMSGDTYTAHLQNTISILQADWAVRLELEFRFGDLERGGTTFALMNELAGLAHDPDYRNIDPQFKSVGQQSMINDIIYAGVEAGRYDMAAAEALIASGLITPESLSASDFVSEGVEGFIRDPRLAQESVLQAISGMLATDTVNVSDAFLENRGSANLADALLQVVIDVNEGTLDRDAAQTRIAELAPDDGYRLMDALFTGDAVRDSAADLSETMRGARLTYALANGVTLEDNTMVEIDANAAMDILDLNGDAVYSEATQQLLDNLNLTPEQRTDLEAKLGQIALLVGDIGKGVDIETGQAVSANHSVSVITPQSPVLGNA